ncbi:MAG TPA: PKD domain-containing protein [Chitinophagales bacterium]|nr:PKD domain-containing protein [Chitinophagales bacterium]
MKNVLPKILFATVFSGAVISFCAAQPTASFSINYSNPVCNPSAVSFTNTSFGNTPLTYQWFFGTDTIPDTSANPSHLISVCGSFTVALIATDTSLLSDTIEQTVLINCTPQAAFTFTMNSVCDSSTVQFTDASNSQDTIATWQWLFGDAASGENDSSLLQNPFHFYAVPGVYFATLTVTTVNGCTGSFSDSIIIHFLPSIEFTFSDDTVCFNDTVNFSGSSESLDSIIDWQYTFDDTASGANNIVHSQNASHVFLTPGNYLVTLHVTTISGCGNEAIQLISVKPFPFVDAGADQNICKNDSVHLQASGGISYTWMPVESLTTDSISNPVAFPSSNTKYFVTAIDSFGCKATDSITVLVHSISVDAGNDTTICNGISTTLHATGGVYFHWQPAASLSDSAISDPIAFPSSTTKYFVTGTDSFGCKATDSVTVFVYSIAVDAGNDTAICNGASATLHVTGGISFQWQPSSSLSNDTIANPIASPQQTTVYTVTIVTIFGCEGKDSVAVVVYPTTQVSITGLNSSYCTDHGVVTMEGNPEGGIFSGSGVSGNQFNPSSLAPDSSYDVFYIYPDSFGCTTTDTETVSIHSLPFVDITSAIDHVCLNGNPVSFTLVPSGGILSGPGISGNTFDPQLTGAAGDYQIFYSATDSFGCSNEDSTIITVISIPNIIASGDTTICFGDSAQLNVTGGSIYFWQPASSLTVNTIPNPKAFPTVTTFYSVIGIDNNLCSNFDTVLVTVINSNYLNGGNDTAICFGDSITLHGSGGDSYSWSPGNLLSDSTIANPVATLQVTTTFTVTAALGVCIGKDSVTITVNSLPQIDAGTDTSLCVGDAIQLQASGGISYQWDPSYYLSDSTISNPIASPPFTFNYSVTGTDSNGCSGIDNVIINVYALPQIAIHVDSAMCFGDTLAMFATGANYYQWQPTTGLSAPDNNSTLAFPQTTTTYTVYGYGANNCLAAADSTITVHPLPVINATADQFVCPNNPIQLSASGGNIYSWKPPQGLNNDSISNPVATVNSTTTFTVTVTDTNFCSNKDSVTLTLLPPLNASVSSDTIICAGSSAQLFASGGVNYVWIPITGLNDGNIANPISSPDATVTYTVYISDGVCYTDTFSIKVTVQSPPAINAGPDVNVISGSSYQFNVTATNGNYQWLPEDGLNCATCLNPLATPQQTTTFTVTVTDSAGCKASDEVTLTVACGDDVVFVPNTFTPNDNGHNDVLYIRAMGNLTLHYFRVYNRWGKIIFETHDFNSGWNGNDNGKPMSPGAYLYEWSVSCENGTEVKKEGNVTLLR